MNVTDCKAAVLLHLSVCGGNCLHDFNFCSIVHGGSFVCAVKEQLAGDEDLKEYNVKSDDTNESSSGIFQSLCFWCFSEGSLLGGHLLGSLPAFSPLFDGNTWKILVASGFYFFVTLGWTYAESEEEMRVVQQGRKNTRNFLRKSSAEVAGMGSLQTDVKKQQKITSRKRKNVSVHEESEDNM